MNGAACNSARRGSLRVLLLLGALWAHAAAAMADTTPVYTDSAVKAAFVLRFAGYVQWPVDALGEGDLVIAVLGDAAMAENLEALATGRSVAGRTVSVRRVASVSQSEGAHVLVVGRARRGDLRSLLRPLGGRSVLVVSSEERALDAGSVINFISEEGRVRFEIALPAARRMGLRVSSELLSVAARVVQ